MSTIQDLRHEMKMKTKDTESIQKAWRKFGRTSRIGKKSDDVDDETAKDINALNQQEQQTAFYIMLGIFVIALMLFAGLAHLHHTSDHTTDPFAARMDEAVG